MAPWPRASVARPRCVALRCSQKRARKCLVCPRESCNADAAMHPQEGHKTKNGVLAVIATAPDEGAGTDSPLRMTRQRATPKGEPTRANFGTHV